MLTLFLFLTLMSGSFIQNLFLKTLALCHSLKLNLIYADVIVNDK